MSSADWGFEVSRCGPLIGGFEESRSGPSRSGPLIGVLGCHTQGLKPEALNPAS